MGNACLQCGLLPTGLSPGWAAYYAVLVLTVLPQSLSVVALCYLVRVLLSRRWQHQRIRTVTEPVAVIVPCYLPNEASIIKDTICHMLAGFRHVDRLDLYVVYNTPHEMAIESELESMALESQRAAPDSAPGGRRLHVHRVEGSTSKAANLNYALPLTDHSYVAIFDADHHPEPDSLALSIQHLDDQGLDCVQGSTFIRQGQFPLRGLVNAEFFLNYFVLLPLLEVVAGTGFFGGANGTWRGPSLRRLTFDTEALTEDIDAFVRGFIEYGMRFAFLPESRSGELAPAGLRALWKQRLRWAMGWDQVTARYVSQFSSAGLPFRKRFGLYYVFVCRWATQFCAVVVLLFNVTASVWHALATLLPEAGDLESLTPPCIRNLELLSFVFFESLVCFGLACVAVHARCWRLLVYFLVYIAILPAYVFFNSVVLTVSLISVACGNTGGWVVTSRYGAGSGGLGAPLVAASARQLPNMAVLSVGLVLQSGVAGALVGKAVGTRKVVHPLWGWFPFVTVTTYVVDGSTVAKGLAVGLLVGCVLSIFILNIWSRPPRSEPLAPHGCNHLRS